MRKSGKQLLPLSISSYGILFLLFALTMFGVFGWKTIQQLTVLKTKANEQNQNRAYQEIESIVSEVVSSTKTLARTFSSWDETIQQLSDATYYSYWLKHRVPSSGFVPDYFISIKLYDKKGMSIAAGLDQHLPDQIDFNFSNSVILNESQKTYYLHYQPITAENRNEIIGYLGIKINFLKAISALQRFKYADIKTVRINADEGNPINVTELAKHITASPVPNREFIELQNLMIDSFNSLAWSAASLALMYLVLQYVLLGIPSRKLSECIDALNRGKIKSLLENIGKTLPVLEFDKIRQSLIDYQQKLDTRDADLKKNETRMRAVLENIVDAIITTDERGCIVSCNPAATIIFKTTEKIMVGKDIISMIADASLNDYYAYFGKVYQSSAEVNTKIEACELLATRMDGNTFPIELLISKMFVENKVSYIMVIRDITERKQTEERLIYLANYDELTGLPNRALFQDRLSQAMERALRWDKLAAVVFIDLDSFKKINDTLGHSVGDLLLIRVAERIKHCLRSLDTVARLGGDEYMVILEDINHIDEVSGIVKKILAIFNKPFVIQGNEIYISASAGISILPFDDTDVSELVKNADTAMFKAKELGGNSFKYFTADMNIQIVERLKMENALRRALEKNEFELYYQPIHNLESGNITGMEALLRWNHPDKKIISPGEFIPLLEETGLIVPVGEWVLEEACRQAKIWNDRYDRKLLIAVNLSVRQFLQQGLCSRFSSIVSKSNLNPNLLELEITEGILVKNVDSTIQMLEEFHNMGISISVDDFGTGYSSLAYLKKFPINTIKIDKSFVRDVNVDKDDAAIVTAIIAMAKSLRINVIAEGIETEAQLNFLKNLQCNEAQGFYFSQPLPGVKFEQLICNSRISIEEI